MTIDPKSKRPRPASETGTGARPRRLRGQQSALLAVPPAVLLDHFRASLVLITPAGAIVSFYGPSERYLAHSAGRADLDLFSVARPQLAEPLRTGVRQAVAIKEDVHLARIPLVVEGGSRLVDVTITPYVPVGRAEPLLAVIFQELFADEAGDRPAQAEAREAELRASRADLRAASAEFEASREQMLATQEEAAVLNEELQSTNEELEASQEELQSLNEELTTLNAQLNESMGELAATNSDLLNFFGATKMAMIFLDRELRIRRFTPAAEGLLNVMTSDLGRRVHHLAQNFAGADLAAETEAVLRTLVTMEREVVGRERAWYTLRAFPYRTSDGRVEGVMVTFADVSRLKQVEASLRSTSAYSESIIAAVREPLVVLDADLRVVSASGAFCRAFQICSGEADGKLVYELGEGQWDLPALRRLLGEVLPSHTQFEDFEVQYEAPDAGRRTMLLSARGLEQEGAWPPLILLAIEDITERKQVEKEKQVSLVLAERTRIAREIHDTLAQNFTGIFIQLEVAEDALADDPPAAHTHLLRARELAREGLAEARRSVWNLRPQALEGGDLVSALVTLIGDLAYEASVEIRFSHQGVPFWLPPDTESNLLRVCQEALANARTHARASSIRVTLVFDPQQVELRVEDDGQGFDLSQQPHPQAFGLVTMAERAKRIWGQLILDSQPGQGTRVVVRVPRRGSRAR